MSKKIIYLLSLLMALSIAFTNCKKTTANNITSKGFYIQTVNFPTGASIDEKVEMAGKVNSNTKTT